MKNYLSKLLVSFLARMVKSGSPAVGRRFCEALQSRGVLAQTAHTHVIRFAPPLIIMQKDLDWVLEIIEEVLMMP